MLSSTLGSGTRIGWKRRSSAASFSMLRRYSSMVVAPTTCSSPRDSGGFSMLPADIAPSPPRRRPDDGVDLVDEDDQLVGVLPDLVHDLLQPLLEVAPVAGAGDDPAQVELDEPLAAQRLGDLVVHDPLREPLGDRGLAHAGIADQHRVVLGAPRQDLDGLLDLLVPPDHRVDLALPGEGGQVAAELVQRRRAGGLAAARGPGGCPPVAADCSVSGVTCSASRTGRPGAAVERQREQQMFGADVGRPQGAGDLVRVEQGALGGRRQLGRHVPRLAAAGVLLDLGPDLVRVGAGALQPVPGALLPRRRPQQVVGVQVETSPLRRLRRRVPQHLARRFAHQPRDADPLHGTALGTSPEEAGEQLLERVQSAGPLPTRCHLRHLLAVGLGGRVRGFEQLHPVCALPRAPSAPPVQR